MNQQNEKDQYNDSPKIESFVRKSKDGRYVIHRTVITHIKPVKYYAAVLSSANEEVDA